MYWQAFVKVDFQKLLLFFVSIFFAGDSHILSITLLIAEADSQNFNELYIWMWFEMD